MKASLLAIYCKLLQDMLQLRRVYAITATKTKMTFFELATTLGLPSGTLRSDFSRHKRSIHRPADVQKFLATRFLGQKRRRKTRLPAAANHLQKWRFVKKIKRVEVSPAEEQLARESALMAAKERKTAAVARATAAEKGAKQAEKIRILEEKLRQNEAVIAAKERKIASLTRQINDIEKPVAEVPQPPIASKAQQNIEQPEPQIVEKPTTPFGVVPSAESRKAAALARRKEKKGRERKPSFRETEAGSEQKSLPRKTEESRERARPFRVPEIPVVENIVEEVGDENLRPTTPIEAEKTPETKAEAKVEVVIIPVEKIKPEKESNPENPLIKQIKVQVETLTTEIATLRAETREQIGKIEIKEEEVFAKIPVEEVGDENFRPATPTEEIKSENPATREPTPEPNIVIPADAGTQKAPVTREPTPEPNIVIPADAGTQKAPVAELTQPPIEPKVQQNIEQPETQTAPPNPPS